jgi:hypothetical protein
MEISAALHDRFIDIFNNANMLEQEQHHEEGIRSQLWRQLRLRRYPEIKPVDDRPCGDLVASRFDRGAIREASKHQPSHLGMPPV